MELPPVAGAHTPHQVGLMGTKGKELSSYSHSPAKKQTKPNNETKKTSKIHIAHQTAKEPSTVSAGSPTHRSITSSVWREMTASRTNVQKAQYATFVTQNSEEQNVCSVNKCNRKEGGDQSWFADQFSSSKSKRPPCFQVQPGQRKSGTP